jgi:hypothetical protein
MTSNRVSVSFYLAAIPGAAALSVLLTIWGLTDRKVTELMYFSWIPLIFTVAGIGLLVYNSWVAIQDGQARTTPGLAVVLGFIPIFNLYWVFQAWYGFAVDYNRYLDRHGLQQRRLSPPLYLAFCIGLVLSAVPFVGLVTALPQFVLLTLVVIGNCRAVNQLSEAAGTMPGETLPSGISPVPIISAICFLAGILVAAFFLFQANQSRRYYDRTQIDLEELESKIAAVKRAQIDLEKLESKIAAVKRAQIDFEELERIAAVKRHRDGMLADLNYLERKHRNTTLYRNSCQREFVENLLFALSGLVGSLASAGCFGYWLRKRQLTFQ